MKTTTKTGKNQNFCMKVPEGTVEAIEIISSSLETLIMIRSASYLNQWEPSGNTVMWQDFEGIQN